MGKKDNPTFDVVMGSYGSAELYELVKISSLKNLINKILAYIEMMVQVVLKTYQDPTHKKKRKNYSKSSKAID